MSTKLHTRLDYDVDSNLQKKSLDSEFLSAIPNDIENNLRVNPVLEGIIFTHLSSIPLISQTLPLLKESTPLDTSPTRPDGYIKATSLLEDKIFTGRSIESVLEKPSAPKKYVGPREEDESETQNTILVWDRNHSETIPTISTESQTDTNLNQSVNNILVRGENDFFSRRVQESSTVTFEDNILIGINVFLNDPTLTRSIISDFDSLSINGAVISLEEDNTFSYQPARDFNGSDSFSFTILDINGQAQTSTINITVIAVSDGSPVSRDDSLSTNEDSSIFFNPTDNDTLTDEASIFSFDSNSLNGASITSFNSGTFLYTPLPNYNGIDTFTYTLLDSDGQTDSATVTVAVFPVSDESPDAVDDNLFILEDEGISSVDVTQNDRLSDEAFITSFDTLSAEGAVVTLLSDGSFSYSQSENYNGIDSFTYTLLDSDGQTDTATVTIVVSPVSDGTPEAINDNLIAREDTTLIHIDPTANDLLPDEASLINFDELSLQGGTVTQSLDGTLSYTPSADFNGIDSFTYNIVDSDGQTDTAIVNINVASVNDAPVNNITEQVSVARNGLLAFNQTDTALVTISDVDNNIISTTISVTHGVLNIEAVEANLFGNGSNNISIFGTQAEINNALNLLSYQPDVDFGGFDTLTITTQDNQEGIDEDTLSIRVEVDANPVTFNTTTTPSSTGLILTRYANNSVYSTQDSSIENSQTIEQDISNGINTTANSASRATRGLGALVQSTVITEDNSLTFSNETGDVLSLTGLIYLEANNEYRFVGTRDDALYIELGGQTLVETSGNSSGNFSTRVNDNNNRITESTLTPTVSGYYTLEIYAANLFGSGEVAINLSVNNTDFTLSADNFSFYANATEVIAAGGRIHSFAANTSINGSNDGGYFAENSEVDTVGIEGQVINLSNFSLISDPNDQLINLNFDIPTGATLFDNNGNTFTSTLANSIVDVIGGGWSLTSLSLLLPNSSAEDIINIPVTAVTQSISLNTETTSTTLSIGILPTDFEGSIDSDIISNPSSDALITGSGFNDLLNASASDTDNAVVLGLDGNDTLIGNNGNNTLFGGTGDDVIIAGLGEDFIFGGTGSDRLSGGDDNDTDHFIWLSSDSDGSRDVITDFTTGVDGDIIDLSDLLTGESSETLSNFLQINDSTISVDSNGDGSGFNDAFIQLDGLDINSLSELSSYNIIYDAGRSILRGSTTQDTITGREFNGLTTNEDFYGNGGGDNLFGNGGADRYFFESNDFSEFIPTLEQPTSTATVRIQDLFTFGIYDGSSEVDAVDFSDILVGENIDNINNYLTINTRFSFGGTLLEIDINGDNSGTDFSLHIKQDNLDIEAELGYTNDVEQLEILQLLINNGNIVID